MDYFNEDEPLADGLRGVPRDARVAVPGEMRDGLRALTSAHVRRRPARRRALAAGLVAVAYVCGAATMAMLAPKSPAVPVHMAAPIPEAGAGASQAPHEPSAKKATPDALLARVLDAPRAEQIALLTHAGDLYLRQYGDVERALNCYRQVLELTPLSEHLAPASTDTWLFASLKQARKQEMNREKTHS